MMVGQHKLPAIILVLLVSQTISLPQAIVKNLFNDKHQRKTDMAFTQFANTHTKTSILLRKHKKQQSSPSMRLPISSKTSSISMPLSYLSPVSPLENDKPGVQDLDRHMKLIDASLIKLSGAGILERTGLASLDSIHDDTKFVVISYDDHPTSPTFNYGNAACLQTFAVTYDQLCRMVNTDCVVSMSYDEKKRAEMLRRVLDTGIVDDCTGVRLRGDGKLFRFYDGVVWTCYDESGAYYGMTALFDTALVEWDVTFEE